MSRYLYKAVNAAGKSVAGELDAQSSDHANELIATRGLSAIMVTPAPVGASARNPGQWLVRLQKVHPEELILFTKQLATMLRAGIPVLRVFDILETQTENVKLKAICAEISAAIRGGSNLYGALRRHPEVFSALYCSMVLAGETSGTLPQMLQRLIYVISHEYKVKSDVRAVLQYPIIVLIALATAFVILITLVIPRFATVYARAQIVLPLPTRICMALSELLRTQWMAILLSLAVLVLLLAIGLRTPKGRFWRDRLFLNIPLIGPLMLKSSLSRLASIFSILQASGVGILDSVQMLADTIGNAAIGKELTNLQSQLEAGRGIANPLMSSRYFTPLFINMVAVGEEAGNLDEMLREISLHYDAEVEYATRRLTTAMGPALIALMALMVGFFALAVYLPMWDMAKIVSSSG